MYAIVDIETTGSYAAANGITEISIHIFDGQKVVEKFETLVNPGQPIPFFIQKMTGITDAMVAEAPYFQDIAEKIFSLLSANIFVAHNVNFDYSFINAQLKEAGFILQCRKLCTVRLSRKIFPGLPSYSLGKLCHALGIHINNRHRAGGDTAATVKVFKLLLQNDKESHIEKSLKKNAKESILPPNVPKEDFEKLPYCPGVYYFHNAKGKVVYVGKAVNIRYRVNSHFSNNAVTRQKQYFLKHVFGISYQACATELMASILESAEIKKRWPVFNTAQKHFEEVYGLFLFEDQNGYHRLAIDKNKKRISPVYRFHLLSESRTVLSYLVETFNLCPKLCFLQHNDEACTAHSDEICKGACQQKEPPKQYNKRVKKAIDSLQQKKSFIIKDVGLNHNDYSCILVLQGQFFGMGYLPNDKKFSTIEKIKEQLTIYKENSFTRNLVHRYAAQFPEKVIELPAGGERI